MAPRISYDLSTKPESEATFEWFLQHIQASRGFPALSPRLSVFERT